jgi:hypothetical protein
MIRVSFLGVCKKYQSESLKVSELVVLLIALVLYLLAFRSSITYRVCMCVDTYIYIYISEIFRNI